MKKIILLIPLMLFSIFENSYCMNTHRKSMKKMYAQNGNRKNKKSLNRLAKKRKRKIKSKKVNKRQELDLGTLPYQKKSSIISSFVPRGSFSLGKKNLISTVLLLYMIFGQILSKQQVSSKICKNPRDCQHLPRGAFGLDSKSTKGYPDYVRDIPLQKYKECMRVCEKCERKNLFPGLFPGLGVFGNIWPQPNYFWDDSCEKCDDCKRYLKLSGY
ncbi:hypothetical protein ACFLYU_04485 [Candidatus Dependentiae bacterium]